MSSLAWRSLLPWVVRWAGWSGWVTDTEMGEGVAVLLLLLLLCAAVLRWQIDAREPLLLMRVRGPGTRTTRTRRTTPRAAGRTDPTHTLRTSTDTHARCRLWQ